MNKLIDHTGQRFGRLTVIEKADPYIYPDGFGRLTRWLCRCDCGKTVSVAGTRLRNGTSKSCGCLRRELLQKRQRAAYEALRKLQESGDAAVGKSL